MKAIDCPKCGMQYHISEIYVPQSLVGNPVFIDKDEEGKITKVVGNDSDFNETYRCDKCNTLFDIHCEVKFNSAVVPNSKEHMTHLFKSEELFPEE